MSNGIPDKTEVRAFLEFILTEGQAYAPEVGYIGLAEELLKKELSKLQKK